MQGVEIVKVLMLIPEVIHPKHLKVHKTDKEDVCRQGGDERHG